MQKIPSIAGVILRDGAKQNFSNTNTNLIKNNKTNKMKKNTYVSPALEVAYMVIEQGIAASPANGIVEDIYLNEEGVDW